MHGTQEEPVNGQWRRNGFLSRRPRFLGDAPQLFGLSFTQALAGGQEVVVRNVELFLSEGLGFLEGPRSARGPPVLLGHASWPASGARIRGGTYAQKHSLPIGQAGSDGCPTDGC